MTHNTKNTGLKHLAATLLAVAALGGITTRTLAVEYYRWVGPDGTVHMSDKRPEQGDVEVIKPKPPVPRTFAQQEAVAAQAEAEAVAEAEAEAEAEANAPAAVDPNAPRELRCQQERERLSILRENDVVHMQDANGNLKTLSQTEMQQEIAVTEKAITALCD